MVFFSRTEKRTDSTKRVQRADLVAYPDLQCFRGIVYATNTTNNKKFECFYSLRKKRMNAEIL